MSGLFRGSQLNWGCLTKEAYAIYMSIKKLAYYLEDADITLRSDHLPLKKFLAKNTLNSKVNNWAIEISPFCITFEYIKGIKNTLADTRSRLINIDPQIQQDSEPEGYEFGYYTFDTLPTLEVSNIETTQDTSVCVNDNNNANNNLLELPINNDMLFRLQQKDRFCANILAQIEKENIIKGQLYIIQDKLLKRYVVDSNNMYETIVLPRALTAQILKMAHDNLGHNGHNIVNTEDERHIDTTNWTLAKRKKLQHMTEFHEEYHHIFDKKASIPTIMKRRISHMNPPMPDSVCKEEMQNATVDTKDVIIEYITDAQGRKIKKLKPLLIKMEPDREYIQHVHSDDNLPDVPENNFIQKREVTINSYSETISSDSSSDDSTITADNDYSASSMEDKSCI